MFYTRAAFKRALKVHINSARYLLEFWLAAPYRYLYVKEQIKCSRYCKIMSMFIYSKNNYSNLESPSAYIDTYLDLT